MTVPSYCRLSDGVEVAVRRELSHRSLLKGVERLGLAVSGGADSVALFHLLLPLCREAGISAYVLHLNHGLRDEADSEELFVKGLASAEDVPFYSHRAKLGTRATGGESLEMAARTARLAFFTHCSSELGLQAVATGHQADDVAETVLLRLARGAGAAGLAGLRPISHPSASLVFIRPLLAISGLALRAWLLQRKLDWRDDKTNLDDAIPRNFVRNRLIPQLEQTWVATLRERLCQSAEALREDDALLETLAQRALEALTSDGTLPTSLLIQQPEALQRRLLRRWLFLQQAPGSAGLATILTLLDYCRSSGNWHHQLSSDLRAVCSEGILRLTRTDRPVPGEAQIPLPGRLQWGTVEILTEESTGVSAASCGIGRYPALGSISSAALNRGLLSVRSRRPGDRISPTGLSGSKKLHDLFIDEKVPNCQRGHIPIFVCGNDVVWIPGYRVSRSFAVPSSEAPCIRITVREA